MNKTDYIAKYGPEKWEERLRKVRESKQRKKEGLIQKEAPLCVTVDFNVPVPPKEEGMTAHSYRDFKLQRGQELAYKYQRVLSYLWYREHSKVNQCIVIVEPIIYKGKYRMRTEFYVANITPNLKDWLTNAIKKLDYE